MSTINLLQNTGQWHTIHSFPDGQHNVTISGNYFTFKKYPLIEIKSRLTSWVDMEIIIACVKSLRAITDTPISLYISYFLGGRSDRKFEAGSNNYLRDVISPVLNSLNINQITVFDPHSDVLEACLPNISIQTNMEFIREFVIPSIINEMGTYRQSNGELYNSPEFNKMHIVSPDIGALKKIGKIAERINYKRPIVVCTKDRDINGRLSNINIPVIYADTKDVSLLVIDDICDGGATFVEIAKRIREKVFYTVTTTTNLGKEEARLRIKLYLAVSHGIFSKGFDVLLEYYDGIYCTNSYKDITHPKVAQFKII